MISFALQLDIWSRGGNSKNNISFNRAISTNNNWILANSVQYEFQQILRLFA